MKLTLISALCLMSIVCFAQNQRTTNQNVNHPLVSFGIKGGINIANVNDSQTPNTTSLKGFHGGIFAHIHFNRTFALQPEVVYSRQGAVYPNFGDQKNNYINVPVLLQYMFLQGFRLETGPQAGILLSSELKRNSGGETDTKYQATDADFSWAFGFGYLSPMGIGIDARYNLGLTYIAKRTPADVKNQVWQFGLFYQFMR